MGWSTKVPFLTYKCLNTRQVETAAVFASSSCRSEHLVFQTSIPDRQQLPNTSHAHMDRFGLIHYLDIRANHSRVTSSPLRKPICHGGLAMLCPGQARNWFYTPCVCQGVLVMFFPIIVSCGWTKVHNMQHNRDVMKTSKSTLHRGLQLNTGKQTKRGGGLGEGEGQLGMPLQLCWHRRG